MPQYRILTFAAAADIVGADHCLLDLPAGATVAALRVALIAAYPAFGELVDFAVARNEIYAGPEDMISPGDVVVVIPPVSGG